MQKDWIVAIDARSAAALASGALQPVQAEQTELKDGGLRFIVRWVSSLAAKDETAKAPTVAVPGGPRDPDFNPFLNPDPELTVGPLDDTHVVILNKFPLCERHLVLARREFEEQLLPLAESDFHALAVFLCAHGGLGLYNGGTAAGASQRHKHVQWIPHSDGNASLRPFLPGLPMDAVEHTLARHDGLKFRHAFVRVACEIGTSVERAAASMQAGFDKACAEIGLEPGEDGLLPAYNLLVSDGWLLVVPRKQEHFEDISLSAVCFGGTLYIRHREQVEAVKRVGPLQVLATTAFAD